MNDKEETDDVDVDNETDESIISSVEEQIYMTLSKQRDFVSEKIEEEVPQNPKRPSTKGLFSAITHLDDGTPIFVPEPGEYVLIDRSANFLKGKPWIETRLWKVKRVNEETGDVLLYDDSFQQWGATNYIKGHLSGDLLFLQPKKDLKIKQIRVSNKIKEINKINREKDIERLNNKRNKEKLQNG
jgi:hypothetical protein